MTDKNEAPELLPCPFCGGEAVRKKTTPPRSVPLFETGCNNVGCRALPSSGKVFSQESADKIWNTRTDLAVTVKQLEWESIYNLGTLEQAVTPIGIYTISDDEDKAFGTFVYFHLTPEGDSTRYGLEILESGPYEVEEAKAATQADYEKRILSALDLTPADATAALQAEKDAVWNEAIDAAMTVCAEWEETFEKRMSNGAAHGASECFRDVRKLKREVK